MTDDELRMRVGVSHLLTSYQYLADTGKVERLTRLFAPDGVLEVGDQRWVGPEAILSMFRDTATGFTVGFAPGSRLAGA